MSSKIKPPIFMTILFWLLNYQSFGQCGTMSLVSDHNTLCQPASFKWVVQNAPSGSKFMWNFGTGLQSGTDTFYSFIQTSGKISVSVQVTLLGGAVCDISKPDFVEVYPSTVPELRASRKILCEGPDTVTYLDITPNSVNRTWSIEGKYSYNTAKNYTHTFTSVGVKKLTMVVEDVNGCIGIKEFDSVTLIYAKPSIDFSSDFQSGCVNKKLKFTPTVNSYGNKIAFTKWIFPGGMPSIQTKAIPDSVLFSNSGVFSPQIDLTAENGCNYSVTKQNYLSFGASTVLALKISDTAVCLGKSVLVESINKSLPGKFQWSSVGSSNVSFPDNYSSKFQYDKLGKYNISVLYDHNGCTSTQILNNSIRVRGVKSDFVSNNNSHCKLPHLINLSNNSVSFEPGNMSYRWEIYEGGLLIHTAYSPNDSFMVTKNGLYDVHLITSHSNGCSDVIYKPNFISNQKISPDFTAAVTIGCVNQKMILTQKTGKASSGLPNRYFWTFYNNNQSSILGYSTDNDPSFSYPDTGRYSIKLVADNAAGCKDSIMKTDFIQIIKPKVNFELLNPSVCENDILHVKGNSSPENSLYTYSWTLKNRVDGSIIQKDGPILSEFLTVGGQYDLKLVHQINGGCRDSIVNNYLINSNLIRTKIVIDSVSGCLPFTVKPRISILENYHIFNSDTSLKCKWSATPSSNVSIKNDTSDHPEYIFNKAGEYTIHLFVQNSVGCSEFVSSSIISAGVQADFSVSDFTVCSNQNVVLGNLSAYKPTFTKWIFNNGIATKDSSNQQVVTARFVDGGIQKIGLVAGKNNQCFDTLFKNITSLKVKAAMMALQPTMKCAPVYSKFISQSINADLLIWDFGDGNVVTTTDSTVANIYRKNSGSVDGYDLTLIAISNQGCSDTLFKPDYMKIIGPQPDFDIMNTSDCETVNATFVNKSKNVHKYYFNYEDGSAMDTILNMHTYTHSNKNLPIQMFLPKMYASDKLGCMAVLQSKDTIFVFANPKPDFNLNDSILCTNTTLFFSSNNVIGSSSNFYVKGINNYLYHSTSNNDSLNLFAGDYFIKHVIKDYNGCYDSLTRTVSVLPSPKADFEVFDSLCYNKELVITNLYGGNNLITNSFWEIYNASDTAFYSLNDAHHTFTNIGEATVKLSITDSNQCRSSKVKTFFIPDPSAIPSGSLKAISVNADGSLQVISNPNSYNRFLYGNYYNATNKDVIKTSYSKSEFLFIYKRVSTDSNVCIDYKTVDICGYESKLGDRHCAMVLKVSSTRPFTNELNWTNYIGWNGIDGYNIYRKQSEKEGFVVYAKLSQAETNFIDSGLCNSNYTYYIEARNGDLTSKSNIATNMPMFIFPDPVKNIKNVTVTPNSTIEVTWLPSANPSFKHFTLYRISSKTGKKAAFELTNNYFVDQTALPGESTYIYSVSETDRCGNVSIPGKSAKTILLNTTSKGYNSVITWNQYQSYQSGIRTYTVQLEKEGAFRTIYNTGSTDSFCFHDQTIETIHGAYCYRVMAISGDEKDTSYSNTSCVISPSKLFFANAFSPNSDGINDRISAKSLFVLDNTELSKTNFNLEIFNGWGEKVYTSKDIDDEWDGITRGVRAASGVYMYKLRAIGADNRYYTLNGSITIVR